jgi:hypothetical protein
MARMVRLYRVRIFGLALLFAFAGSLSETGFAEERPISQAREVPCVRPLTWRTDYREALAHAKTDKTLALIWFYDPAQRAENEKFASVVLEHKDIRDKLPNFSLVKLPLDGSVESSDGEKMPVVLLNHVAFAEMLHKPGIALVDMRDESSKHFHHVVSVYPFVRQPISPEELVAMLDLPAGSLTQRTLIWAVRTHAEHPQSTGGSFHSILAAEVESHSVNQASLNLQGHHNWEERFHSINGKLGGGMISREVCAESWPNQHLVEAAQECVHSWRQSSGHWESVSGSHDCFAYDLKLGTSGVWYATGIFGDRR